MERTEPLGQNDWWATGDTPVRRDSRVNYLVDGRSTMMMMCRHFMTAHAYIYLANWGMTADMDLIRGEDHSAGPEGSPERANLIAELQADGLSNADIQFWLTHELSVKAVLGYAVSKGVEVKVLLWKSPELFSHNHPGEAQQELEAVGVTCLLDDSAMGIIHHPVESLHQKISIVDGRYAFVGGVDPLTEEKGQFDRWDTPEHRFSTPLRRTESGDTPYPWHDAHAIIEGPATGDVEYNFRQRWNDLVQRHHWSEQLLIPAHPNAAPLVSQSTIQIARTIPEHTYQFEPMIVRGIAQHYAAALNNIQRFVYLENQYLWLHAFSGIDIPFIGNDNQEMEQNIRLLGDALNRGATLSIILPDHPNVGRAFSDAGLQRLRDEAPQAVEEGRLQAFCLATSIKRGDTEHYRPIYVHAKVAIVDDVWSTVGSANLNNRGMCDDTEENVAALDSRLAQELRYLLQGEHLGLVGADDMLYLTRLYAGKRLSRPQEQRALNIHHYLEGLLSNPLAALQLMHERAWENLQRYKAKQPLIGHLLPYLTKAEAEQQELPFREEHGWVEEPLPE
jgi:phosphatidylserine/phosphatidylglycerophosphate/cardiolipin synthase-like enzyme